MCASSQPAVATYAELRSLGRSRGAIASDVRRGELSSVRRGVYASTDACDRVRSAAAHGGALACVSAARHLGLWVLDDSQALHVWMRGHGHRHHDEQCGCVEHWDDSPPTESFGLPSVPRILRQILACRGIDEFFVTLESALRKGLLTPAGLTWLQRHTNDAAREAIAYARDDADSGIESLFRWKLRSYDLRIRSQVLIFAVGQVDFLIGDRLLLEIDGKPNHVGESERHKDLFRDANAAAWDYVTLRFDYALVVHDWELVEAAVVAQVNAGRHLR